MKKIISIVFILVLAFTITACGNNVNNNGNNNQSTNSQTSSASSNGGGLNDSHSSSISGNLSNSTVSESNSSVSYLPSTSTDPLPEPEIGTINLLSFGGYQESASITFSKVSGAEGYNVYYKKTTESDGSYKRIDSELIREYEDCVRADILGLPSGEYDVRVASIKGGNVKLNEASKATVRVESHVREGFAFSKESPNKTASGAYCEDGSLQQGAKVLYITKDNVNTVTLEVATGNGKSQVGTGLVNILYLRQKGYDKTPLSIRFIGKINDTDITGLNSSNYIQIKGCYNVTVEGVGDDATCYGWSFLVRQANNVEVRNFGFMRFKDDGVSLDTDNNNIWVHNNDFFYGSQGSDSDQAKGDGSLDVKLSNYITLSYNHFWDSGKSSLCGMKDTTEYFVTYHHNWFDHSDSRHPRIRVGTIHVYNNLYDGISKYGIGATTGSSCFVESNYFLNTKHPMLSSMQGSDEISQNFSGESGGIIKAFGNIFDKTAQPIDYSQNNNSFDCYTVQDKFATVPETVVTKLGGTKYNNFDTKPTMYSYSLHTALDVPGNVKAFAGRVGGGDFKFVFADSENTNYAVIPALSLQITNYSSKLISVGGNSI